MEKLNGEIILLFKKYINRQCSNAEIDEVMEAIENGRYQAEWDAVLSEDATNTIGQEKEAGMTESEVVNLHERIMHTVEEPEEDVLPVVPIRRLWPRIVAAASILMIVGTGVYLFRSPKQDRQDKNAAYHIVPGSNKAILTLGNGKQVNLNDAKSGVLAKQGAALVNKTANGQLVYQAGPANGTLADQYNTVTTPNGGQWHVVLADGTNVWLNAASSLHYPSSFSGKNRKVELTGEAYFEVAKDKQHPFIVTTGTEDVQVLGTHFNINAYAQEAVVKTTLLEGSVKVSDEQHQTLTLKPGQQATLTSNSLKMADVDVEDAVAWKNGLFTFDNETLQNAMYKIARWYDVDVVYVDPATKDITLGGSISRFGNLTEVLNLFEKSGKVHFTIEGRKLLVRQ